MFGWKGKILKVDLTAAAITIEDLNPQRAEDFLGAAGLGAKMLYELVPPSLSAESPDIPVIFGAGPLVGTLAPSSGRLQVTHLSPITGIFGDSNCGGDFAPELKYAGFDQVIITGRAKTPVYLWIDDNSVTLRDASRLWGKPAWDVDEQIKEELGDYRIKTALIGPAAQNGVLYGIVIINKYRTLAKTGPGTTLARKNFLGIAVRGSGGIPIARPEEFEQKCEQLRASMKASPTYADYTVMGTLGLADQYQATGRLPTKNRLEAQAPNELYARISNEVFRKEYKVRDVACFNCPVRCSHWFEVRKGRYAGQKGEKPELVALEACGTLLANYDFGSICFLQNATTNLGLDIMEFGNTLAWAMEVYEKGIITTAETGGIPLDWGNADSIEELLHQTVEMRGFGKIIGLGVKRAAQLFGSESEKMAMQVKGYGMSLVEVRNAPSWGLAFATASRGGDHLKALPAVVGGSEEMILDLFGTNKVLDHLSPEGKGNAVAWFENYCAVLDSIGLCKLGYKLGWVDPRELAPLLTFATGVDYGFSRLMKCGERIYNVEKAFNVRRGLGRKEDTLPRRFFEEPVKAGPRQGETLGPIFDRMLDDYYLARGWDPASGLQESRGLKDLGLDEVAADLKKEGRLAPGKMAT